MEVKPGYKQTEVGLIPQNWEVASLGTKTTKVGSGITPTGGERVYEERRQAVPQKPKRRMGVSSQ